MSLRRSLWSGAVLSLAGVLALSVGASAASVQITETGSSLLYPLFNEWAPAYGQANPGVQITPQSTGSGTGISDAENGTIDIGASDAYVSTALMAQHPNLLNIPVAVSAQQVMYNLPGLNKTHIHLNGPVLAAIYMGKITKWNDSAIAKLNPGVKLPNLPVVPIHRADGSGDTFLFTQYLSFTTKAWNHGPNYGTTISWPSVPGSISATGNQGMVQQLTDYPGAVAYIGISWLTPALKDGLGEAALQNKAGQFLLPNNTTIGAAVAVMAKHTPKSERLSLINAPGKNSYPIINYEYVIVSKSYSNSALASAIKKFLLWAIDPSQGGNAKYLGQVHFLPLPSGVMPLSTNQIDEIH